jgi:hypothetical protein
MIDYKICPDCGRPLDNGEQCDCAELSPVDIEIYRSLKRLATFAGVTLNAVIPVALRILERVKAGVSQETIVSSAVADMKALTTQAPERETVILPL